MVANREPRPRRVALRAALPGDAGSLFAWRAEESVRRHQPLQETTVGELRADLARQRMEDLYRGRGERFQWIVMVDGESGRLDHARGDLLGARAGRDRLRARQRVPGHAADVRGARQLLPDLFVAIGSNGSKRAARSGTSRSQRVLEKLGFPREGRLRSYFSLHGAARRQLPLLPAARGVPARRAVLSAPALAC